MVTWGSHLQGPGSLHCFSQALGIIFGDFNIHEDNPSSVQTSQFLDNLFSIACPLPYHGHLHLISFPLPMTATFSHLNFILLLWDHHLLTCTPPSSTRPQQSFDLGCHVQWCILPTAQKSSAKGTSEL